MKPRSSHTLNHTSHTHKRSSANQNDVSRYSSTNIPASSNRNSSLCSKNSQGTPNVLTDTISLSKQHAEENTRGLDRAKLVEQSNLASSHKDFAVASPQKHSEKRKHCDPFDTDRHRQKHKHSQNARCEGHRISHLVKRRTYKKKDTEETESEDQRKSDDYVLAKLFKKSGMSLCTNSNYCQRFFSSIIHTKEDSL